MIQAGIIIVTIVFKCPLSLFSIKFSIARLIWIYCLRLIWIYSLKYDHWEFLKSQTANHLFYAFLYFPHQLFSFKDYEPVSD